MAWPQQRQRIRPRRCPHQRHRLRTRPQRHRALKPPPAAPANSILPIKASAEIMSDGPVVVTLAGSVWSTTADQLIGIALVVDGEPTPITASIFSNGPTTHRPVVPAIAPY